MPGVRVELLFLFSLFPNEEELRWFTVGVIRDREEKAGEAVCVHTDSTCRGSVYSLLCIFYIS